MAIRKRKNGRYFIDITFNRKRLRFVSPDNKITSAKAYEDVIKRKLALGEPIKEQEIINEMPPFKKFALEWLESYSKAKNRLSEYKNKLSVLNVHLIPWFGNIQLDKISTRDIDNFISAKINSGLSPKTVNNHLIVLSRLLHIAYEWEAIGKIPKIKKLKVTSKKIDFLEEDELQLLLTNSEGLLKDMIMVAARTGLRFGELIALKYENINLSGLEPSISVIASISRGIEGPTKSGKARYIPLINEVQQILINRYKPTGYVFADENGKFLAHTTYLSQIKKACLKAGLRKIGWHTLRHTFASHLAMNNIDPYSLQKLMGHNSINTTMIYAHLSHSTLIDSIKLLEKPENVILGTKWAQPIFSIEKSLANNKKMPV